MNLRNKKGLTFIELIVVMAIMAILATISFVSIQYAVEQNAYKTYSSKCRGAMELCETNADLLNGGLGVFQGVTYFTWNAGTSTTFVTNFQNMIASRIPPDYAIKIRTSNSPLVATQTTDTIIVYIRDKGLTTTGVSNAYKFSSFMDLKVEGAWFYKANTSTAAMTVYGGTEVKSAATISIT